jgi:hypothetical protein
LANLVDAFSGGIKRDFEPIIAFHVMTGLLTNKSIEEYDKNILA